MFYPTVFHGMAPPISLYTTVIYCTFYLSAYFLWTWPRSSSLTQHGNLSLSFWRLQLVSSHLLHSFLAAIHVSLFPNLLAPCLVLDAHPSRLLPLRSFPLAAPPCSSFHRSPCQPSLPQQQHLPLFLSLNLSSHSSILGKSELEEEHHRV